MVDIFISLFLPSSMMLYRIIPVGSKQVTYQTANFVCNKIKEGPQTKFSTGKLFAGKEPVGMISHNNVF